MNSFQLVGEVIQVTPRKHEKAPWTITIQTTGDTPAKAVVNVFRNEAPVVGSVAVISGYLDSFEWQGRRLPEIRVRTKGFLAKNSSAGQTTEEDDRSRSPFFKKGGNNGKDPQLPF